MAVFWGHYFASLRGEEQKTAKGICSSKLAPPHLGQVPGGGLGMDNTSARAFLCPSPRRHSQCAPPIQTAAKGKTWPGAARRTRSPGQTTGIQTHACGRASQPDNSLGNAPGRAPGHPVGGQMNIKNQNLNEMREHTPLPLPNDHLRPCATFRSTFPNLNTSANFVPACLCVCWAHGTPRMTGGNCVASTVSTAKFVCSTKHMSPTLLAYLKDVLAGGTLAGRSGSTLGPRGRCY